MANAATENKAGLGKIIRGLASAVLKSGFIIAIAVWIANTFMLKSVGVAAMIIASLIGVVVYLIMALRSTTKANRHETPDIAMSDSLGDLALFGVLLTTALLWSFIPNFSGMTVVDSSYYVTLAFFWVMFGICVYETVLTIGNSLYQMYRVQQIRTENA